MENLQITEQNKTIASLRIVFLGTPEFAVASLDKLLKGGCNIVGVVTAPDKPAGRGMQLQQSDVKKYAVENGLHVLQPEKLKHPDFLDTLRALKADLQIVVAFRMLPEVVWNMPPMGTINLHGSLLPQYRGAAPINWAVINGEKETGVTTFKLLHQIDTGNILMQDKIAIDENETAGELHDVMKETGAALLLKTVEGLANRTLKEIPQEALTMKAAAELKHAPKLFTETCKIDFSKTASEVHNLIRGLSPYPAAFTFLDGKKLKIYKSEKIENPTDTTGAYHQDNIFTDQKTFLHFQCSNGTVAATEVQLEGKKKMTIGDFLRGYRWN